MIKIRSLQEKDLLCVTEIARQSFSTPWSLKSFETELLNTHSILKVAEVNGEIVGYIVLRIILDEAELLSIAVKPDFRQNGIATALIKNVVDEMKNIIKICFLEVRMSNYAAIRLYEKSGFKKIGVRNRYYILPEEDAIIMKLEIS